MTAEARAEYRVTVIDPARPVRCICGSLAQGRSWPFRGDPWGEHVQHCLHTHGSRSPFRWLAR